MSSESEIGLFGWLLGSCLLAIAVVIIAFILRSHNEESSEKYVLVLCSGAKGDYSHCSPMTHFVKSRSECGKAEGPAMWGAKAAWLIHPTPEAGYRSEEELHIFCLPVEAVGDFGKDIPYKPQQDRGKDEAT